MKEENNNKNGTLIFHGQSNKSLTLWSGLNC